MADDGEVTSPTALVARPEFYLAPDDMKLRLDSLHKYHEIMKSGRDYGVIPGTGNKPTLLKPGAEILCRAENFTTGEPTFTEVIEDWSTPLFYYRVALPILDAGGRLRAVGIGSCNSKEKKYAYRWVWSRDLTADQEGRKAQLVSRSTRNGGTQYRVDNDEVFDLINTIQKMAVKRAFVDATLRATGASGIFTQDVEDFVEGEYREVPNEASREAPPSSAAGPPSPTGRNGEVPIAELRNETVGLLKERFEAPADLKAYLQEHAPNTIDGKEFLPKLMTRDKCEEIIKDCQDEAENTASADADPQQAPLGDN